MQNHARIFWGFFEILSDSNLQTTMNAVCMNIENCTLSVYIQYAIQYLTGGIMHHFV